MWHHTAWWLFKKLHLFKCCQEGLVINRSLRTYKSSFSYLPLLYAIKYIQSRRHSCFVMSWGLWWISRQEREEILLLSHIVNLRALCNTIKKILGKMSCHRHLNFFNALQYGLVSESSYKIGYWELSPGLYFHLVLKISTVKMYGSQRFHPKGPPPESAIQTGVGRSRSQIPCALLEHIGSHSSLDVHCVILSGTHSWNRKWFSE